MQDLKNINDIKKVVNEFSLNYFDAIIDVKVGKDQEIPDWFKEVMTKLDLV